MLFPSTLVISADLSSVDPFLADLDHQSITNNPDIYLISEYTIENIRSINVFLSKAPYNHSSKIVIIPQADLLNVESQNALLKNLEEPGNNNYFILLSSYPNSLIPTILSRCQVIKPAHLKNPTSELLDFPPTPVESLALSETLPKDKSEFLKYLHDQINNYQQLLIQTPSKKTSLIITKLIKATQMISANIDPKSVADFLLLS